MMNNDIVQVRHLSYIYSDGYPALKDISFQILQGESVGIVGANGAGKSTLLMHMVGVLLPSQGEVYIGSIPINKKNLRMIRQKVWMVFQEPDDQLFMPSVYEDVAFGPRNDKVSEIEVEKRVKDALDTVGILHLIDRPSYKLSGGEKHAAAIATVLAMQPDILVMDEPTSALDPKSRRRLIRLLQGFTHTKMIATHDLDMVLELCERTIVLKQGEIIAEGETKKVLTDEKLMEQCGLELPLSVQNCPVCRAEKTSYKTKGD
jgi:cobalt/nickel transport system ATP-binding protein